MSKKVLLVCGLGLSSSLLVEKLKFLVSKENKSYDIYCSNVEVAKYKAMCSDIVLLAPQISSAIKEYENICQTCNAQLGVINQEDYGKFNVEKILGQIDELAAKCVAKDQIIVEIYSDHSSSMVELLLRDMEATIKKKELPMIIQFNNFENHAISVDNADVILIEPIYAFRYKKMKENIDPLRQTIAVIDIQAYRTLNGDFIVNQAKCLYDELVERRREFIKGQEIS